jgi:hypothetical protein
MSCSRMTYSIYLLIGVGLKSQIYVVMIMRVDYVGSHDPGPLNGICFHSRTFRIKQDL